jgi:hypothetical protein
MSRRAASGAVVALRPEHVTEIMFEDRDGELYRVRTTTGRAPQARRIANFVPQLHARIEVVDASGVISVRYAIVIESTSGMHEVEVDAARPLEFVPTVPGLYVETRQGDYVREAIERAAVDAPPERRYAHTGWIHTENGWLFLHAVGAIGADGSMPEYRATVDARLSGYTLPDPPTSDEAPQFVRAAIDDFLGAADESVTLPLLAAVARAPLGSAPNYLVHLAGETGAGKTSIVQLAAGWFGPALAASDAPVCAWNSTATDLEITAAQAKDVCVVVDDYLGTRPHEQTADRLLRTTTGAARGRRRADLSARANYRPGGLIISTGEDTFGRASAQARACTIRCAASTRAPLDAYERAREAALNGEFATATACYVQHLARVAECDGRDRDGMPGGWAAHVRAVHAQLAGAFNGAHPRQLAIVVDLVAALAHFFAWATDIGAVTETDARKHVTACAAALVDAVEETRTDEATEALQLLRDALAAGDCHVTLLRGGMPEDAHLWGWRDGRPSGPCVGYLDDRAIGLIPNACAAVVRGAQHRTGNTPNVTRQRLAHLFIERGWLDRNTNRRTYGVRRRIGNARLDLWPLSLDVFAPSIEHGDNQ